MRQGKQVGFKYTVSDDISCRFKQYFHNMGMSAIRGMMQSGPFSVICTTGQLMQETVGRRTASVHIREVLDQKLDDISMSLVGCLVQRG
jgi:hypothetical protein